MGTAEGLTVTKADPNSEFAPYLGDLTLAGNTFLDSPMEASPVVSFHFEVVPEPSTLVLAVLSLLALLVAVGVRRRLVMSSALS